MANNLIPAHERNLTPDQVVFLDARRRRGQLCLTICFQALILFLLVLIWAGQDATYSPGWHRPMVMWDAILFLISAASGLIGLRLRRGSQEFISY